MYPIQTFWDGVFCVFSTALSGCDLHTHLSVQWCLVGLPARAATATTPLQLGVHHSNRAPRARSQLVSYPPPAPDIS